MTRKIKAKDVWEYKYENLLFEKKISSSDALIYAKKQIKKYGYVDVHCHVFEYVAFLDLINDLYSMNFIDLFLVDSRDVLYLGNEFLVALKKS